MTENPRDTELRRLDRRIAEATQEKTAALKQLQAADRKLFELNKERLFVESCT